MLDEHERIIADDYRSSLPEIHGRVADLGFG